MLEQLTKAINVFLSLLLIFQLTGCGTILYPERKGQKDGRIDIGVAVLDGIGLLFFLIPGIIAYAVDFNNGTIYLPGGTLRTSTDMKNIRQVKFDPKTSSLASIERIITKETGRMVKLDADNVKVTKLKSTDEMMTQFASALSEIQNDRLALLQ
jgi:hypothetical protein